jgi:hypothetical protein
VTEQPKVRLRRASDMPPASPPKFVRVSDSPPGEFEAALKIDCPVCPAGPGRVCRSRDVIAGYHLVRANKALRRHT